MLPLHSIQNTSPSKTDPVLRSVLATALAVGVAVVGAHPAYAQTAGLDVATNWLTGVKAWVYIILPILAVIAAAVVAAGYWFSDRISHDEMYRWIKGILFLGCAPAIVTALITAA